MQRFKNKTVVITGGGSGIGAAAAKRFASEGANVVVGDTDESGLKSATQGIDSDRVAMLAADLSQEDGARALVAKAQEAFGSVDVVVPNAGYAQTGTMGSLSSDDFFAVVRNNMDAAYLAMKCAWEPLMKAKGCVVATSSVSGERGDFNAFAYNVSKHTISALVRGCALDFQTHGIRVNGVAPGFTHTGLTEDMEDNEDFKAQMYARIPMGRGGEPEEIASAMAFLASDDASFVNGVILPVDGGLMASNGQPPLPG